MLYAMLAIQQGDTIQFVFEGFPAPGARTTPTIRLARALLRALYPAGSHARQMIVFQVHDRAEYDVASVAYGRRVGASPAVRLLPDTVFLLDRCGFREIRDAISSGRLPHWNDRRSIVFWRGSPTTNGSSVDGGPVERLEQVPRVTMCLALKHHPRTDVAIMAPWPWGSWPVGDQADWLSREGVYRPPAMPMIHHAKYRFLIDIDGMANAWSFFEKLLLGACILKVRSPFEQWFYGEIAEWQHFVPIEHDLADLTEKIEWCQQHQDEARAIAERGQRFAMQHNYEVAWEIALDATKRSIIQF
jgi:hypothetical protein